MSEPRLSRMSIYYISCVINTKDLCSLKDADRSWRHLGGSNDGTVSTLSHQHGPGRDCLSTSDVPLRIFIF